MTPLQERGLIQRCRDGDEAAWNRFFEEHYPAVGRFVYQLVPDGTVEDVEEVCQDTFLAAIRALGSFKERSQVQTWLFRIAANKAKDFRNRRLAAKRGSGRTPERLDSPDPDTGSAREIPGGAPAPDEVLQRAEAHAEVRRALDLVGEPCREMLELRYFADLDYESLGQELKLNTKTVSSRLSRCLDRLGGILSGAAEAEASGRTSV